MKTVMSTSMTTSLMFTQMKHPMTMGMTLMAQTMMVCLISGMMSKSFWFSYLLFMIMVGGMLVLFMYMTSLASNEMMSSPNKMLTMTAVTLPAMIFLMPNTTNEETNTNSLMENEIKTTATTMFNQSTMTIMLVLYMLTTLIVVVNMINISSGPLRHTK
nr:NADH dehydrogenase subunit 6 [Termitogeton planus]